MVRIYRDLKMIALFLGLMFMMAACAGTGDKIVQKPPGQSLSARFWVCQDQSQFITVSTGSPETIRLVMPVGSIFMKAVASETGARYEVPGRSLTIDGDSAVLNDTRRGERACREQREKSIIEDARYRGVTYRAMGNEPGWVFEVGKDMIVFVSDYGKKTDIFKPAKAKVDRKTGVHRYDTANKSQQLKALLNDYLCDDSMSGDKFPSTAEITVDETAYKGCGYWLAPPQD